MSPEACFLLYMVSSLNLLCPIEKLLAHISPVIVIGLVDDDG
jgi:hypothetical protein